MVRTAEKTRKHFRERIPELKSCVLCLGDIDADEESRGIIEFNDGWFWICSKCRLVVGKTFDLTQIDDWGEGEIPPYLKRSRKCWLKWLEKEYQIKFS